MYPVCVCVFGDVHSISQYNYPDHSPPLPTSSFPPFILSLPHIASLSYSLSLPLSLFFHLSFIFFSPLISSALPVSFPLSFSHYLLPSFSFSLAASHTHTHTHTHTQY